MEKNTVWAIALSTLVLVAFFVVQTFVFPPKRVQENSQTAQNTEVNAENSAAGQIAPNSANPTEKTESNFAESEISISETEPEEREFVVETDRVRVTFTNRGGDIIGYELVERDEKGRLKNFDKDRPVVENGETVGYRGVEMAGNVRAGNRAFALSLGGVDSPIVERVFDVKVDADGRKIGFSRNFGDYTLYKVYTFKDGEYLFRLDVQVVPNGEFKGLDFGGAAYSLRTQPQIGPRFNPKDRYDIREIVAFDAENEKKFTPKAKNERAWKWTAVAGKYFEALVEPFDSVETLNSMKIVTPGKNSANSDSQVVFSRKATGSPSINDSYYVYIGPRNDRELKKYVSAENNAWGISDRRYTESLPTSGILNWVEIVLKFIMELIYRVVPNWGVSIVVMTVLLRLALFPLTKKSLEGTQKMQAYQPRIKELQEKYKNDPQRLQQEQMRLYKEIGYNPMAGCLPLLIQFIILWSMYHLFNNYFEFRGAAFIDGWISDLSSTDTVATFGFNIPFLGNELHVLPIIYLVSQLLYGVITQNGGTAANTGGVNMKMMMYVMPIAFFFLFYSAPSGLLLYWTVSNVFQLFQQLFVNRMMKSRPVVVAKSAKSATVQQKKNQKKNRKH